MNNLTEQLDTLIRLGPGFVLKFVVAVLCGGAIGMERERMGKPAGLRTCILVCIGSMLFTIISVELAQAFNGDTTRIAAQIVTGVGFLGAGAILHGGGKGVHGMTSAAIIWVISALGMFIGAGYLLGAMVMTAAIVVIVLLLRFIENRVWRKNKKEFGFTFTDTDETRERIIEVLNRYSETIADRSYALDSEGVSVLRFTALGSERQLREMTGALLSIKGVYGSPD